MTQSPPPDDKQPLRILLSAQCAHRLAPQIEAALCGLPHRLVNPGPDGGALDADVAFVSRDVTGLSTKHEILPATQIFYDAMLGAQSLRWLHVHSAGADRAVYQRLRERGVALTTSAGANAGVVAQTAVAGMLSLARHFPLLAQAQREHRWAPLIGSGLPQDLEGQTAMVVGWGAIGQKIARLLEALDMNVIAVRQSARPSPPARETLNFDTWRSALPQTDWLVLACPLTSLTRRMVDEQALSRMRPGARLINVSRGDVVDEGAVIAALQKGALAGAFLDVFAHEPLPAASPLWDMRNVVVTPHSAGFSAGNEESVARIFIDNLGKWVRGQPLANLQA